MIKANKILLLFLLNQFGQLAYTQNDMLIEQLSNRMIIRENFDENKSLINKQTFQVGKINKINDYLEVDVLSQLFDKKGKSIDKFTTVYKCKPNEFSIMVMIFPFSNSKSKKTKITSTSKNFKELYDLNKLEEIEMEINFESGLLDFFGSKSKVRMYNRVLKSDGLINIISSKLDAKAYAIGLRIKHYEYTVIEKLNPEGLLNFQMFTEEDGSYFTMTYK